MQLVRNLSIKRKLTLLMVFVSGASMLAFTLGTIANDYTTFRSMEATQLTTVADMLASNSTAAMLFQRPEAARELLASLEKRPTVEYACLFDNNATIFAAYRRNTDSRFSPPAPEWTGHRFTRDGYLDVCLPVTEEGQALGTIYLRATMSDLFAQLFRHVGISLIALLFALAIAVLIAARLQRIISTPIVTLATAAGRISREADYTIRVEPQSTDEIGALYRQFNVMLQRIQTGEEELRRLTAIIEATSDLVGTSTLDGQVTYINRAGRRLLGLGDDEQLTGMVLADIHPEWAFQVVDSRGIATAVAKGTWEGETAVRARAGTEVPVSQVIMAHKSQGGDVEYLSTIMRDIAGRKRAEKEREKLIVELEANNAELERFAYTVSHDLKTPLITIKGYVDLLQQDVADGNNKALSDDITRIADAANIMGLLLRQVLELSRIGRVIHPSEDVGLAELAREALKLLGQTVSDEHVDVRILSDLPVLHGDRIRLIEVLQNLIENAVKYMGDQPEPLVEIGSRQEDDEVVCYVRDNGLGIDPRYHDKVFGLFDQLDKKVEGSGVGLALVKRIVEVHGGRIWVESQGPGQGSAFCFTVPPTTA